MARYRATTRRRVVWKSRKNQVSGRSYDEAMMRRERAGAPRLQVHRALSSPARTRIVEILREEPSLDAAVLAERLGLHLNTVRAHLNVLEDAELVEAAVEERARPGRPRLLYRAMPAGQEPGPSAEDAGYRFLASILASFLGATSDDPVAAAERAGHAWGGFVVDEPPPFSDLDPEEGVRRLVEMLEEYGFDPLLEDREPHRPYLVLRRCPFLDVAREHQDVVCSIHLGLMRGALEELGVDVRARDLIPWATPDTCVSHLEVGEGT
jgi:predicted ArsR family transcriptional regulator